MIRIAASLRETDREHVIRARCARSRSTDVSRHWRPQTFFWGGGGAKLI
jgi:hypothetical protein